MAVWQSQLEKPTVSKRTFLLVERIEKLVKKDLLITAIRKYFEESPNGEAVAVACFEAVGEKTLRRAAKLLAALYGIDENKGMDLAKQYLGLWIPAILCEVFGEGAVYTYRRRKDGACSARYLSRAERDGIPWVSCYTPHKILRPR